MAPENWEDCVAGLDEAAGRWQRRRWAIQPRRILKLDHCQFRNPGFGKQSESPRSLETLDMGSFEQDHTSEVPKHGAVLLRIQ